MQYGIANILIKTNLTKLLTLREQIKKMKQYYLNLLLLFLPMMVSANAIENGAIVGVYEADPSSYRIYNGNQVVYGSDNWGYNFRITITDNLDGTYHVSDFLGGYYDQGRNYGSAYAMSGDIMIADDGTVSLLGSYVRGWGDSLLSLTGKYDSANSTFTIEAEYVEGMMFYQTWVKKEGVSQSPVFSFDGINYQVLQGANSVSVSVISKRLKYSGDIIIPDKVVYNGETYFVAVIAQEAFSNCTDLTSVVIPKSVMTIDDYSFENCTALSSVTLHDGLSNINYGAFSGCSSLTSITIPSSVNWMFGAFFDCSGLKSVTISNGVTTIEGAFMSCTNLTTVDIPNSVTNMAAAFSECTSLTSILIPDKVTNINGTFSNCTSLASISIPNSVTEIGGAFWGCTALNSITIPSSVTTIGNSSFRDCTALTSVIIPYSVTEIGDNAFYGCTALSDIYCYADEVPRTSPDLFESSVFKSALLHVKASKVDAYKAVAPWNKFRKIVELPQCAKPTIRYDNGRLHFNSDTEDVIFESSITDSDIKSYTGSDIELSVTYTVNVYATKTGYENSDVATATLCWIDAEPTTEGITDGIANVRAKTILIQTNGNSISISGANEGSPVNVYDTSGKMVGSGTTLIDITNIPTSLKPGEIGLVKIGEKTIKILMK